MSETRQIYNNIVDILNKLDKELHKVAARDDKISQNELNFIDQVETRIPSVKKELDHVFKDDDVNDEERKTLYQHLGSLLDDSIAFAREDDRIDAEEIFLITKLKEELAGIINRLKEIQID